MVRAENQAQAQKFSMESVNRHLLFHFWNKNHWTRLKIIIHSFSYFLSDPLGIVVYNDLPDGACFTRSTLARDSARSCPSSAASAASVTSKFRGSGKSKTKPTTLSKSMMRATDGEPLVYETVDKPAEVGYFFQLHFTWKPTICEYFKILSRGKELSITALLLLSSWLEF